MTVLLADHSTAELSSRIASSTLVVPIGSTEQHGPHLSVATDAVLAEHVARSAASQATAPDRPVLVAPTLNYGASDHHLPHAGTLSVRGTTYLALLIDILESAVRTGYRRIVLLNGHGGNEDLARQAAREVTAEYPAVIAAVGYWTLAWGRLVQVATRHGLGPVPGHAGAFETSLVAHVAPQYADVSAARRSEPPPWPPEHPLSLPWMEVHGWIAAIDGHSDGVQHTDAAVGAEALEAVVDAAAEFLREVASRRPPERVDGSGRRT